MSKDDDRDTNNSDPDNGRWKFTFAGTGNPHRDKGRGREISGYTPSREKETKQKDMEMTKKELDVFNNIYALLEQNESLALDDDDDKKILCHKLVKWFVSSK